MCKGQDASLQLSIFLCSSWIIGWNNLFLSLPDMLYHSVMSLNLRTVRRKHVKSFSTSHMLLWNLGVSQIIIISDSTFISCTTSTKAGTNRIYKTLITFMKLLSLLLWNACLSAVFSYGFYSYSFTGSFRAAHTFDRPEKLYV